MHFGIDELRERARERIERELVDDPVPFLEWLEDRDQMEILLQLMTVLSKHSRREDIYADDSRRDELALSGIQAVINGLMIHYINEKVEEAVA